MRIILIYYSFKAEETKMALERKVRDVEMVAHRLMQDNERHNRENQYRSQVLHNSQQVRILCLIFYLMNRCNIKCSKSKHICKADKSPVKNSAYKP